MPDRALGNGQLGRYLLVVNDKNVRRAAPRRNRRRDRWRACGSSRADCSAEDRVVVSGIQRAVPGSVVEAGRSSPRRRGRRGPCRAGTCCPPRRLVRARTSHDRQVLHRAAGPRQRHRRPDHHPGAGGPRQAAGCAVSQHRAADRAGHRALSGRQCRHRRRAMLRCRSSRRSTASRA